MSEQYITYENRFNQLWEEDNELVRQFIREEVNNGIAEGKWQDKSTRKEKALYWVVDIANDLYRQKELDIPFLSERLKIISASGFSHSPLNNIKREDKDTLKTVSDLLKGTRGKEDACLRAVAIFGISFEGFDDWKNGLAETQSNNEVQHLHSLKKGTPKRKSKVLLFTIVLIAIAILGYVLANKYFDNNVGQPENKPTDYTVMTSSLFTAPVEFSAMGTQKVTLFGHEAYSWRVQEGSQIGLDSLVIKLTLRNDTYKPAYIERLVLRTSKKSTLQNLPTQSQYITVKSGFTAKINAEKDNWDYVYKVIKDDEFSFLPAFSESDALISVKGDNSWGAESIEFTFLMDVRYGQESALVRCDKNYVIGFQK